MIAGLDLAGKETNPSGIAILNKFNFECSEAKDDREILETLKDCKLVAIDAPLGFAKKGHLRECDLELRELAQTLPPDFKGMKILTERAMELKSKLENQGTVVIETFPRAVEKLIPEGLDSLGFSSNARSEHELDACLAGFSSWCYKFSVHKDWKGIITPSKRVIRMMRIQKNKSHWVKVQPLEKAEKIAVADISYRENKSLCGVICDGEIIIEEIKVDFPYIPSLLAFRELKPIKRIIKQLDFDLLFVNGHGLAHPRGLGMASHLGVELDKPTIGICKRLIVGSLDGDRIMMGHNQVGWKIKQRYLSIGHRVGLNNIKEYADIGIELLKNLDKYLKE
jgi:deoxyribonuclease V